MKSFTIKECRGCASKILSEEDRIIIEPGEEIEIVIVTTAKCSQCRLKQIRTAAGPKLPFTGK